MGKGIIAGGAGGGGAEIPITSTPAENVDIWIDPNEEDQTSSFYTKEETNELIAAIPKPDVSGAIEEHNTSEEAHADIRTLISNLNTALSGKAAADLSNVEAAALLAAIEAAGGGAAKIETGSYIGDGTFGSPPGKTLNFSFTPKMVLIMRKTGTMETSGASWHRWSMIVALYGVTEITVGSYAGGENILYLTWGEKSLQYYAYGRSNLSAIDQLNNSGAEYLYMALG